MWMWKVCECICSPCMLVCVCVWVNVRVGVTAGNHYKNLCWFLDVCLFNQLKPINTHEWQSLGPEPPPLPLPLPHALSRRISMTSCVFRCIHHFPQTKKVWLNIQRVCVGVYVCQPWYDEQQKDKRVRFTQLLNFPDKGKVYILRLTRKQAHTQTYKHSSTLLTNVILIHNPVLFCLMLLPQWQAT